MTTKPVSTKASSSKAPQDQRVEVGQLLLDVENPRLASTLTDHPSQKELVRLLWTEMSVDEVAFSIAANGYYDEEPLMVVPGKAEKGVPRFVVIEGNRRLAAVLLLCDKSLREEIKATELPSISASAMRALDRLPVHIYPYRKVLWAYLGFRHVNGTRPWDAFSKAKYIANVHESFGESLDDIARRIGDRHATVMRLYRGYQVLRQAEQKAKFDREDRVKNRFYFSHLYTAVDQPEFQKFLGITDDRWKRTDPVPKSKLDELAELMVWLYGRRSADIPPLVRTQYPDLNTLRAVIAKPAALSLLRTRRSLDAAYEASIGDKRRFRDALTTAKDALQTAKGTVVTGYTGEEDLFEAAEAIVLTATSMVDDMKNRRSVATRKRRAS